MWSDQLWRASKASHGDQMNLLKEDPAEDQKDRRFHERWHLIFLWGSVVAMALLLLDMAFSQFGP
ncbi:protein of unknown function [Burkholderia multivorans]